MNDYRINWAMPMPQLGAKIERTQSTAEDRLALELCKFEQKRHEVEPAQSGWIYRDYENEEFPLGEDVCIIVLFKNGEVSAGPRPVRNWSWHGGGTPYSIVAYKVLS